MCNFSVFRLHFLFSVLAIFFICWRFVYFLYFPRFRLFRYISCPFYKFSQFLSISAIVLFPMFVFSIFPTCLRFLFSLCLCFLNFLHYPCISISLDLSIFTEFLPKYLHLVYLRFFCFRWCFVYFSPFGSMFRNLCLFLYRFVAFPLLISSFSSFLYLCCIIAILYLPLFSIFPLFSPSSVCASFCLFVSTSDYFLYLLYFFLIFSISGSIFCIFSSNFVFYQCSILSIFRFALFYTF